MVTDKPVIPQIEKPRIRLDYLDGMRALAAIYVVLFHVYAKFLSDEAWWGGHAPGMPSVTRMLAEGRWAVDVFIVLSGYCLMLPVARSPALRLEGGFLPYMKRRAIRILPAYYAALLFSIGLLLLAHLMGQRAVAAREISGDLGLMPILSHLLMVQNLEFDWANRINAPMWSVATEWQIYFLLPLLLLPVWRRGGNLAVLAAAFFLGITPYFFRCSLLENVHSYLLGLFALGMVGATISFAPTRSTFKDYRVWGLAAAFLSFACLAIGWETRWDYKFFWQTDTLVGTSTMCMLIWASGRLSAGAITPPVIRFLQTRWLVQAGHFSYSLYLVHSPILAVCYMLIRRSGLNLPSSFVAMLLAGVPLSLGTAFAFYLVFERPFLQRRWSQTENRPMAKTDIAPAS